jgi:hypothetical protein
MKSADGRFEYRDREDRSIVNGATAASDLHRFACRCRSQPGAWCGVKVRGRGHDIENRSWTWNGDFDRPTLAPSIDCKGCWHNTTSMRPRRREAVWGMRCQIGVSTSSTCWAVISETGTDQIGLQ